MGVGDLGEFQLGDGIVIEERDPIEESLQDAVNEAGSDTGRGAA